MKHRITDVPELAAQRLDLPAESMAAVPRLTVTGRRQALVENHKGLIAYSDDCIEIAGGHMHLRIRGAALQLVAMDQDDLLISGTISAVELL